MINRDNGIPKYLQLKDILKNKIISDYRPGSKFMTEQELMHKYNVSCATVAHTMKDLTEEGYFVRKRGSGTFIQIPAAAPSSDNEKLPELFININKKDKMRITEKTKEYSDEHLLEELVIKIDQYPPEILDILKKEFENRGHDLKKLLLEEYEKSGKIKKIFQKVRHIGVAGEVGSFDKYCIGNLYFTSESIFYLPFKIKSDFRNIGWYGSGFLGYLGTELFSEITAKRKKSFKDDLPEDLPPLSLLSRFIKGSICFKKSEIKKVIAAVVMLPGAIKKFSFKTTNKDNDDSFEIQSRDVEEFRSIIKEEGILLESARGLSKWKTIFLK